MSTDTQNIVNKAGTFANVLRDDGLSYMAVGNVNDAVSGPLRVAAASVPAAVGPKVLPFTQSGPTAWVGSGTKRRRPAQRANGSPNANGWPVGPIMRHGGSVPHGGALVVVHTGRGVTGRLARPERWSVSYKRHTAPPSPLHAAAASGGGDTQGRSIG
jgi:hypothetical protein